MAKKYNKKEIMKNAWAMYKKSLKWISSLTFAECLHRAWEKAKDEARVFTGIVKNVKVAGTLMHPVLVDIDMDALEITGNTYPARKLFREFGLDWDKERKSWVGTHEILNKFCLKFA